MLAKDIIGTITERDLITFLLKKPKCYFIEINGTQLVRFKKTGMVGRY